MDSLINQLVQIMGMWACELKIKVVRKEKDVKEK